jgi:Tol biopolymer transport system component
VQGPAWSLRYSPDGNRIRFNIVEGPWINSSAWQVDSNGSNLHPLLPDWKESSFQCCGNWSPNGDYYFFQAGQGNDQAIWFKPEHRFGSFGVQRSPSRLITGPLHLGSPVPSADGKRLFVTGEQLRAEPVRYDSKTRSFESYLNGASISSFEFSPDGEWIAYVSFPEMSLWRSRIDGTEKMQLTFAPVRVYAPRWSPDGSKIAFTDVQFSRPWRVSLISSSGGPSQTPPSAPPGADPNWLPDGKSIVYSQFPLDDGKTSILRQELDTGKIVLISNSEGYFSPRLSPDGRYISAFPVSQDGLLLFDSKANRWSSLAKGEVFAYNIWSRDGQYVYALNIHAGAPRIVRVGIRDPKIEEIVSLKDFPQLADWFAGWFGLTPDGDPVVIRDRSTQQIYALELR